MNLADEQCKFIEPLIPEEERQPGTRGASHAKCSMVCCGYCARGPNGTTYRSDTRHTRPATGASSCGCAKG